LIRFWVLFASGGSHHEPVGDVAASGLGRARDLDDLPAVQAQELGNRIISKTKTKTKNKQIKRGVGWRRVSLLWRKTKRKKEKRQVQKQHTQLLDPRELGVLELVPREELLLLLVGEHHMLRHELVIGDVGQQVRRLKGLDLVARDLDQRLPRLARDLGPVHDHRMVQGLVLNTMHDRIERDRECEIHINN
jgi:hypothetical protein